MQNKEALVSFIEALDKWTILCGLLVALGVGGEFVIGYLHWSKGRTLRAIQESEERAQVVVVQQAQSAAADAGRAAAEANERAKATELEVARANERASELAREAEHDRLERVKLEATLESERADRLKLQARVTPRSITNRQALISALSVFKGEDLWIEWDGLQRPLVSDILQAVDQAGWNFGNGPADQMRLPSGMALFVFPDAPKRTVDAAQALADALRALGNPDLVGPIHEDPKLRAWGGGQIVLMIGSR